MKRTENYVSIYEQQRVQIAQLLRLVRSLTWSLEMLSAGYSNVKLSIIKPCNCPLHRTHEYECSCIYNKLKMDEKELHLPSLVEVISVP